MTESILEKRARKQALVWGYLDTPFTNRMPLPQFLKVSELKRSAYVKLREEYNERKREEQLDRVRAAQRVMSGENTDIDIKDYFRSPENKLKWLRGTLESAEKGNAQSQRLIAQILDVVVEKSEVIHGLTAEEYARIREEGRRRADEAHRELNGDRSLLSERALLPKEIRQD